MAIKINWQDLQKRIINWQEVQKVMLNWNQIRPSSWPAQNYLYFTPATIDWCEIRLDPYYWASCNFEISYDNNTWQDYTITGETGSTIELNFGDIIYRRNKSEVQTPLSIARYRNYKFNIEWKTNAGWDINYLLCKNWTNDLTNSWNHVFAGLFYRCYDLLTPPILSATTLTVGCYEDMFSESWITALPELPATELVDNCYDSMFRGCGWIMLSEIKIGTYQEWFRIPSVWTWINVWEYPTFEMFNWTWWIFQWTPSINRKYYIWEPSPSPLYTPWIYENSSEWLISMSYDWINWLTIANKDLWASIPWERGYLYQRWNSNANLDSTPTTTIPWPINTTGYWPWNYYASSSFVTSDWDWSSPANDNLWGDVTDDYIARRGPCPNGFHVPMSAEYGFLISCLDNLGLGVTSWGNMRVATMIDMLHFTSWGYIWVNWIYTSTWYSRVGCYWTSSPWAMLELLIQISYWPRIVSYARWCAAPIRAFKDIEVIPDGSWTVIHQI